MAALVRPATRLAQHTLAHRYWTAKSRRNTPPMCSMEEGAFHDEAMGNEVKAQTSKNAPRASCLHVIRNSQYMYMVRRLHWAEGEMIHWRRRSTGDSLFESGECIFLISTVLVQLQDGG